MRTTAARDGDLVRWSKQRAAELHIEDVAAYLAGLVEQDRHRVGFSDASRRAVLEVVRARPGIHSRALVAAARLPRREVERQLRLLQHGGLVTCAAMPKFRRYFPAEDVPRGQVTALAELEAGSARAALEFIRREPGLSISDLARRLDVSKPAAHKTVNRLLSVGLVGKYSEGSRMRLLVREHTRPFGSKVEASGRRQRSGGRAPASKALEPSLVRRALLDHGLRSWAERRASELRVAGLGAYLAHLVEEDRRRSGADEAPRQAILDLVRARPGIHRRAVRAVTARSTSAVGRDLALLEAWGMLTSFEVGRSRHYFVAGAVPPEAMAAWAALEVGPARAAYEAVRREPGISVGDLARRLGITQPRASVAVGRLCELGLVGKRAAGRGRRVRLVPSGTHPVRGAGR